MSFSPTRTQILQLIQTGCLHIEHHPADVWFALHNDQLEIDGRLIVRPDWTEGDDDRPGLMPIIGRLTDGDTVFCSDEISASLNGLSDIYVALRQRVSPQDVFRRCGGHWLLIPHAQCECA